MIHVMNPYQLSMSMFRLAAYSWETQVKLLQVFTHVASQSNPMMLSREAILKQDAAPAPQTASKPAPKPRAKAAVKSVAKRPAKTTARKASPAAKPSAKAAPKARSAVTPRSPATTSKPAEPKKFRAPSKPPAMPNETSTE